MDIPRSERFSVSSVSTEFHSKFHEMLTNRTSEAQSHHPFCPHPFLLRSRCVRARVTRSRRRRGERETYGKVGNRVYSYGLVPIPSLVFVPTDLSILARCVTNVYVTTRAGRGGEEEEEEKKEEGRDKKKGRKRRATEELWRTEPHGGKRTRPVPG